MSKAERIADLELRATNLESDVRLLRYALDQYSELIKGLTGKTALKPQQPWIGGAVNKCQIPPITRNEDANVTRRD